MNEKMKIYIGQRQRTGLTVWVLSLNIPQAQRIGNKDIDIRDKFSESKRAKARLPKVDIQLLPLKPSLKLVDHSPIGFEWGYTGSGPAQLAAAILLDASDKETASRFYQSFKEDFVARFPRIEWFISQATINAWLDKKRNEI